MEATRMTASFARSTVAPARVTYSMPAPPAATCLDRARVFALEEAIRRDLEPVEMPTADHFSHGVYGRELRIPTGTILTGKIHKFDNMNVLLEGEMLVLTDQGVKHVRAGHLEVSPPGTKRAALALTDCRWLTVHGTHETDVDAIEAKFIAQTDQEYLSFCDQLKLEGEKLWLGQQ
jgi:quercetin dioxygenase-like cupin family protein